MTEHGYVQDSGTSRDAAENLTSDERDNRWVHTMARAKGPKGVTCDQLEIIRGYSLSPRFVDLCAAGLLVRTGRRRATRQTPLKISKGGKITGGAYVYIAIEALLSLEPCEIQRVMSQKWHP